MYSCSGVRLGADRGAPCTARVAYTVRGKEYCAAHAIVALKAPARFREAMETAVRRRVRQEAAARYKSAQVDAFVMIEANDAGECVCLCAFDKNPGPHHSLSCPRHQDNYQLSDEVVKP